MKGQASYKLDALDAGVLVEAHVPALVYTGTAAPPMVLKGEISHPHRGMIINGDMAFTADQRAVYLTVSFRTPLEHCLLAEHERSVAKYPGDGSAGWRLTQTDALYNESGSAWNFPSALSMLGGDLHDR